MSDRKLILRVDPVPMEVDFATCYHNALSAICEQLMQDIYELPEPPNRDDHKESIADPDVDRDGGQAEACPVTIYD